MREARLIQDSLLPTASLRDRGIEIAFRFTPFFQVGGDFVDFFRLPEGLIGLYIGDVVGKGLPATMYGALVMGILRGVHKGNVDTGAVLSLLNQRLLQRPLPGASARRCMPSSTLLRAS
jgi:serine phosphatase RsbU (regulator of sigma subunit)